MLVAVGRLGQASVDTLGAALESVSRERGLILDLTHVDYVSSAALMAIDAAASRRAKADDLLVLCGVQDPVRIALDLAGLLPRVAIEASPDEAAARVISRLANR